MAPRKTAAGEKAPQAPATKKSADKVIKRPARGYHKFRNGLLNVTPKGGEKELVKRNENSLLLRMPAEIRNQIWKLALAEKRHGSSEDLSSDLFRNRNRAAGSHDILHRFLPGARKIA
ncbi:hypothetical protein J4E81_009332 [Alternaria sp. BMP 2799]|nr:hypothetical protein J4E81_009332 [Alternaria sp. BMP 2799]